MIFLLLISLAVILLKIQDELSEPANDVVVMARCPGCEEEISCDWMVCPHCLKHLREICTSCQKRKLISHSFCPSCGSR